MAYPESLKELLRYYTEFCKEERKRIIFAHAKYGEDWKVKSNLAERWQEILDEFGYRFLEDAQKKYKRKKKSSKS